MFKGKYIYKYQSFISLYFEFYLYFYLLRNRLGPNFLLLMKSSTISSGSSPAASLLWVSSCDNSGGVFTRNLRLLGSDGGSGRFELELAPGNKLFVN